MIYPAIKVQEGRRSFAILVLTIIALLVICYPAGARQLHVTTSGSNTGTGTATSPWSLSYALFGAPVRAGDTVWVHGGTYNGNFQTYLSGVDGNPIIFRNYNNERAVLRGGTASTGQTLWLGSLGSEYIWFWGIEITCQGTDRTSSIQGSPPPSDVNLCSAVGIQSGYYHRGVKFINCIVHDALGGLGTGSMQDGAELYGNLIYYAGWESTDRGHGHGLYMQNDAGRTAASDNIVFSNFSHNIHCYAAQGQLENITLTRNICFNNAVMSRVDGGRNLLFGSSPGQARPRGDSLVGNHFYDRASTGGNAIGYYSGLDGVRVIDNWFVKCAPSNCTMNLSNTINALVVNNKFYGDTSGFAGTGTFSGNTYGKTPPASGTVGFVYPNKYEKGRANVVVYNWDLGDSVNVAVSGVFADGDTVSLYNSQNYFADAPFVGLVRNGSLRIPMKTSRWTISAPVGWTTPPTTFPQFGVFVAFARKGSGSVVTPPSVPGVMGSLGATPDSLGYGGGTVTLSWSSQNATSASITPSVGTVAVNGTTTISITSSQRFTLSLTGPSGSITYSDSVYVSPNLTRISRWGGKKNGTKVSLSWTTQSEVGNIGFLVEKSLTSITDFQAIPASFTPGAGTSAVPVDYSYDDSITAPGDWYYRLVQIDADSCRHILDPVQVSVTTGVGADGGLPVDLALAQNYPNPFNPGTQITFALPAAADVEIDIYDMLGHHVSTLLNGHRGAGYHSVYFDAAGLANGVYVYRLRAGSQRLARKMVLLK